MGDWLAQLREHDVDAVVSAWPDRISQARSRSLSPCPSCGAERRGSEDSRGPIGVIRDRLGWRCHRCKAGGDGVNLAVWLAVGDGGQLDRANSRAVWDACAERGLCDPFDSSTAPQRAPRKPRAAKSDPPPKRPPAEEVASLWGEARRADADAEVVAWCRSRGLDPIVLAEIDAVRAVPPTPCVLPRWAYFAAEGVRGPWNAVPQGFRILVEMVGDGGSVESLHVRALRPRNKKGTDKAAAPAGVEVIGLVMACPMARSILRGESPDNWDGSLIVAEGEPDWLSWRQARADREQLPAILGVVNGSWTDALAARIPDGARVYVRTHDDDDGHKYARKILRTLGKRCKVFVRP